MCEEHIEKLTARNETGIYNVKLPAPRVKSAYKVYMLKQGDGFNS
jgi:hypothetical protein